MPKPIKKRSDKKEKTEDIQETIGQLRERFKDKQRILVYVLAGFVIVAAVLISFFVYNKVSTENALELEVEGYAFFYGDRRATAALSPAERYKKALDAFKKSFDTKENPTVLLYIANAYYELGNYDDALKTLQDFSNKYSDNHLIPLAYYKMAMAYIRKNDLANALTTLKNLTTIKDSALQDLALIESGRILESLGKTDEAKGLYRELLKRFPQSVLVSEAKARLGEK
jgi:predicted negative regulator of RcsB-dependent stress response